MPHLRQAARERVHSAGIVDADVPERLAGEIAVHDQDLRHERRELIEHRTLQTVKCDEQTATVQQLRRIFKQLMLRQHAQLAAVFLRQPQQRLHDRRQQRLGRVADEQHDRF